jgi:sugar lactone lactonase YvrE
VTRLTRATLVFSLLLAGGCRDSSTAPEPGNSQQAGLWTVSGVDESLIRLAPEQLIADGDRVPAAVIHTPSGVLCCMAGAAFDSDGSMWVTSEFDSRLLHFPPDGLAQSGTVSATAISAVAGSLAGPIALAFDSQHRLWVANNDNGTVVRFDREQLNAGGAVAPAVILSGLTTPSALAFDRAGSLWVSDFTAHTISSFTASQLSTSGSPTPHVVIGAVDNSLLTQTGIAFDALGNLWVGNFGNHTIVSFSATQIAAGGSPVPRVIISSNGTSLASVAGLAFDGDGALWVIGGSGLFEKYSPASLATSGAPSPAVTVRSTDHTLYWSGAFWPIPAGMPLHAWGVD